MDLDLRIYYVYNNLAELFTIYSYDIRPCICYLCQAIGRVIMLRLWLFLSYAFGCYVCLRDPHWGPKAVNAEYWQWLHSVLKFDLDNVLWISFQWSSSRHTPLIVRCIYCLVRLLCLGYDSDLAVFAQYYVWAKNFRIAPNLWWKYFVASWLVSVLLHHFG